MSFKYLKGQSWLDFFILTLPILIPLTISLYFIAIKEPRPEAHADPPQARNDTTGPQKHAEPGSDEAQEAHTDIQAKHPIPNSADLLARTHHLSHRLNSFNNRIHYCIDSTRMRVVRSKLQSATLYRTQDRVRELELEAENPGQGIGELLEI